MSRLLCLLLISYVLSEEITFDVKQFSTPAYDGDCSKEVVCKNDKPSYCLTNHENELAVSLYSDLEIKYADCTLIALDNSTVPITTNNFIKDKTKSMRKKHSYTMMLNLKDAKHGHLKCNFTNCKEETERHTDSCEPDDLLTSTCVANIVKPCEDPEEEPLQPISGYISVMGVIPNDNTEANETLIGIEDNFLFSIKCYENCKGQKFKGQITRDEDTSNYTSTYSRVDVTRIGIDTYEAHFVHNGTQYSCKEKQKLRTFILVKMKSKDHHPRASPVWFIAGVVGITLLVIVGLVLLYKRWKIVSKESKAKIKKSSTQTDNFNLNPNRVSYVELDFDQNVNNDFVPAETTQYATVIGVMAPREPANSNNGEI